MLFFLVTEAGMHHAQVGRNRYVLGGMLLGISTVLQILVIAQVVGWEKPDPTTKASATTRESYTQCHLDVGPALQG
jgi:hypothetical protein